MTDVAREIDRLLAAAREPGSPNDIEVAEVQAWLFELLEDYADELGGPEGLRGQILWDLIAADEDPARDALYLVAVFLETEVELAVGRGPCAGVRLFGESEFSSDPRLLPGEVGNRFPTASTRISLPRAEVDEWIGQLNQ